MTGSKYGHNYPSLSKSQQSSMSTSFEKEQRKAKQVYTVLSFVWEQTGKQEQEIIKEKVEVFTKQGR